MVDSLDLGTGVLSEAETAACMALSRESLMATERKIAEVVTSWKQLNYPNGLTCGFQLMDLCFPADQAIDDDVDAVWRRSSLTGDMIGEMYYDRDMLMMLRDLLSKLTPDCINQWAGSNIVDPGETIPEDGIELWCIIDALSGRRGQLLQPPKVKIALMDRMVEHLEFVQELTPHVRIYPSTKEGGLLSDVDRSIQDMNKELDLFDDVLVVRGFPVSRRSEGGDDEQMTLCVRRYTMLERAELGVISSLELVLDLGDGLPVPSSPPYGLAARKERLLDVLKQLYEADNMESTMEDLYVNWNSGTNPKGIDLKGMTFDRDGNFLFEMLCQFRGIADVAAERKKHIDSFVRKPGDGTVMAMGGKIESIPNETILRGLREEVREELYAGAEHVQDCCIPGVEDARLLGITLMDVIAEERNGRLGIRRRLVTYHVAYDVPELPNDAGWCEEEAQGVIMMMPVDELLTSPELSPEIPESEVMRAAMEGSGFFVRWVQVDTNGILIKGSEKTRVFQWNEHMTGE